MGQRILYKYLDVDGGLKMLQNSNLQFTNATQLNDPFDCHPSLIDYSDAPPEVAGLWGKDIIEKTEFNHAENYRNSAWVCSLSRVHNSLLMWSYYCKNHAGVCIGLNMGKIKERLSNILCKFFIGALEMEVQYKDVIKRPDYFRDKLDTFRYQLSTKAKEWEHEKEVRLLLIDPSPSFTPMALPYESKDKSEVIDWKEIRAYPKIGGDCFDSLYFGVKIDKNKKEKIMELAKKLNPNIKMYQMEQDPEAFKLKEELIK